MIFLRSLSDRSPGAIEELRGVENSKPPGGSSTIVEDSLGFFLSNFVGGKI
jgi:hypothetical protein